MAEIPLGKIELREGKPPDPSAVERRVDYGKSLYASGRADGAREEREAAVRYLAAIGFKDLAGDFEAGEHRKEAGNG